jgi:hypothetical protein
MTLLESLLLFVMVTAFAGAGLLGTLTALEHLEAATVKVRAHPNRNG